MIEMTYESQKPVEEMMSRVWLVFEKVLSYGNVFNLCIQSVINE